MLREIGSSSTTRIFMTQTNLFPAGDFKRPRPQRALAQNLGRAWALPGVGLKPFEEIVVQHGPAIPRCRAVAGPRTRNVWSETFLAALRAYRCVRTATSRRGS
jgi:hypothetical protein